MFVCYYLFEIKQSPFTHPTKKDGKIPLHFMDSVSFLKELIKHDLITREMLEIEVLF